jgi:hypothetical protein
MRADRAISAEVIARLQPFGVEAALAAMEARSGENAEKLHQFELALEQARYETARACRQYEAVDPDNRVVAGELERRWNERLLAVRALEDERDALLSRPEARLSEADRERLLSLGSDLERAWNSPGTTPATRKRIIRTLINEILVRVCEQTLNLVIHWNGGDHTSLQIKKNRTGQHRWSTAADVVDLVRVLARQMPDYGIAAPQSGRQVDGSGQQLDPCPRSQPRNQQAIAHTERVSAPNGKRLLWRKPLHF